MLKILHIYLYIFTKILTTKFHCIEMHQKKRTCFVCDDFPLYTAYKHFSFRIFFRVRKNNKAKSNGGIGDGPDGFLSTDLKGCVVVCISVLVIKRKKSATKASIMI